MEKKLPLAALNDEELSSQAYPLEELWFINNEGHITGPYHLSQLETMLVQHPPYFEQWKLCPFDGEEKWSTLAELDLFEFENEEAPAEFSQELPGNLPSPLSREIIKKSKALAMGELHQAEEDEIVAQETLAQIVRPAEPPMPEEIPELVSDEIHSRRSFSPKWIGLTAAILLVVVSSFTLWNKFAGPEETDIGSFAETTGRPRSFTPERTPASLLDGTPAKDAHDHQLRKVMLEQKSKEQFDANQKERIERLRRYRHPKAMMEFHMDQHTAERDQLDREHESQRVRESIENAAHEQDPRLDPNNSVQSEPDRYPASGQGQD